MGTVDAVFRSNAGRARFAVVMLTLTAAARLLIAGLDAWVYSNLDDVKAVAFASHFERGLQVVTLAILLLTAIAFLLWFRRAYENAVANGLRISGSLSWSVVCWFIPLVNLAVPPSIAGIMSQQAGLSRGAGPLVGAWWTTMLVGNIGHYIASSMLPATGWHGLETAFMVSMAVSCVDVVGALLAVTLVRRLTRAQDVNRLLARAEAAFGDGPAPAPRP